MKGYSRNEPLAGAHVVPYKAGRPADRISALVFLGLHLVDRPAAPSRRAAAGSVRSSTPRTRPTWHVQPNAPGCKPKQRSEHSHDGEG
jgi:hypothetical protein